MPASRVMSTTLRSRYDDVRSIAAVRSSSFWRVACPRRPGTRPSAARDGAPSAVPGVVSELTGRQVRALPNPTGAHQWNTFIPTPGTASLMYGKTSASGVSASLSLYDYANINAHY